MLSLCIQIGEVKKMVLNKNGKTPKKSTGGMSDRLLGTVEQFKLLHSKILEKAGMVENSCPRREVRKVLVKNEFKKSRAIEFARKFEIR